MSELEPLQLAFCGVHVCQQPTSYQLWQRKRQHQQSSLRWSQMGLGCFRFPITWKEGRTAEGGEEEARWCSAIHMHTSLHLFFTGGRECIRADCPQNLHEGLDGTSPRTVGSVLRGCVCFVGVGIISRSFLCISLELGRLMHSWSKPPPAHSSEPLHGCTLTEEKAIDRKLNCGLN